MNSVLTVKALREPMGLLESFVDFTSSMVFHLFNVRGLIRKVYDKTKKCVYISFNSTYNLHYVHPEGVHRVVQVSTNVWAWKHTWT